MRQTRDAQKKKRVVLNRGLEPRTFRLRYQSVSGAFLLGERSNQLVKYCLVFWFDWFGGGLLPELVEQSFFWKSKESNFSKPSSRAFRDTKRFKTSFFWKSLNFSTFSNPQFYRTWIPLFCPLCYPKQNLRFFFLENSPVFFERQRASSSSSQIPNTMFAVSSATTQFAATKAQFKHKVLLL